MKNSPNTISQIKKNKNTSWPKVILMTILVMQSDGLISSIAGLDRTYGGWLYSGLMILFLGLSLLKLIIKKKGRESKSFYYPILVFLVIFLISAVSNSFIFPKPASDWIPSLYIFLPIFIFYALYILNATEKEIAAAFIIVATVVSALLLADKIAPVKFLDHYIRLSSFFDENRRIVLLKNEFTFGAIIIASLMISQRSEKKTYMSMALFGFLFITQIIFMESRLAFSATVVSLIALFHINGLTKKTSRLLLMAITAAAILFPVILYEYARKIGQMSIGDDSSNISIRIDSVRHLLELFMTSHGWGVGMMSPTGTINNILASDPRYNVADTGAFSALGQFGIPGLLLWITLTYQSIKVYRERFISSAKTSYLSAAGFAFLIGYTISALPLSFFFQAWNISTGGLLLYLLWLWKSPKSSSKPLLKPI